MRDLRLLARIIAVLALGIGGSLAVVTAPAAAHTDLVSSDPAEGAVLPTPPTQMVLTFSEELLPDTVTLSVKDDTGMVVRVLSFTVDGAEVDMAWPPGLPGRDFEVNYRVVSEDGHPVSGTVRFSAEESATPAQPSASATPSAVSTVSASPTPVAADADDDGPNLLVRLLGLAVVVAIVIGAVVLVRRRTRR